MAEIKHNVVITAKMQATSNDALIHVTAKGKTDLDNGRVATVNFGTEEVSYATSNEGKLYLICTPEHARYNKEPLTSFYNKQGQEVRVMRIVEDDEFGTDAIVGGTESVSMGDKFSVTAEGKFLADTDGIFMAVDRLVVGFTETIVLKHLA